MKAVLMEFVTVLLLIYPIGYINISEQRWIRLPAALFGR